MAHGVVRVYQATMTSGATLSSAIDLSPRTWNTVYLQVPTMASGDLYIQASPSATGTFNRVMHMRESTGTATIHTFVIGSSASQRMIPIPTGIQFMKIENSSGATDVVTTFNIICSD